MNGDPLLADEQCQHEATIVAWKTNRTGGKMFLRQCTVCWQRASEWLPRSPELEAAAVPFNETAEARTREESWKRKREMILAKRALEDAEWWTNYDRYLQSPEWKARRLRVWEREHGICQGCGEPISGAFEVHHVAEMGAYRCFGNELLFQLVLLCSPCHERIPSRSRPDENQA